MFLDNGYLKSMQHANTSEVDLANANLLESEWLIFLDITEYNMKILLELSWNFVLIQGDYCWTSNSHVPQISDNCLVIDC